MLKQVQHDKTKLVLLQVPPKVEYSFTDIGEKLSFIFNPQFNWRIEYIKEVKPEQYHLIENIKSCEIPK